MGNSGCERGPPPVALSPRTIHLNSRHAGDGVGLVRDAGHSQFTSTDRSL